MIDDWTPGDFLDFEMPELDIELLDFKMPKIDLPSLPSLDFQLPDLDLKRLEFDIHSLAEIDFKMLDVDLTRLADAEEPLGKGGVEPFADDFKIPEVDIGKLYD